MAQAIHLVAFIVLLSCGFWFFLFADIQLRRLFRTNKEEISQASVWVAGDADRVALPMKIAGYVFYAPYLWPIRSFRAGVMVVVINVSILRSISL